MEGGGLIEQFLLYVIIDDKKHKSIKSVKKM